MNTAGMSYSRGPLAIEMGMVTGAVDDLVSGYECLVTALPDVAQRVNDMQNGTEDMAHRLEDRMRYLIDGYEYLDSVASQIPPAIQQMAASHRKNLMAASEVLGPLDKADLGRHEQALEQLRGELKSMAYERVVMDVLTRQSIRDSKRKTSSNASTAPLSSARGAVTARSTPRYATAVPSRASPPSVAGGRNPRTAARSTSGASTNTPVSPQDVHAPIHIDRFSSNLATPELTASTRPGIRPTQSPLHKTPHQRYDVFSAQSTAGAVVVPSVRTGVLPEELRHIKSTPSSTIHGDGSRKRKIPKNQYPAKKRSNSASRKEKSRSKSPARPSVLKREGGSAVASDAAVNALRHNIEQSAAQLGDMKQKLDNAESRRLEDQEFTEQRLADIQSLIINKEDENKKLLEDMQKHARNSGKKRVVVETIVDDHTRPSLYRVLPVRGVSGGEVTASEKALPEAIVSLKEPPLRDTRPTETAASLPAPRGKKEIELVGEGEGKLLVINGSGRGTDNAPRDQPPSKAEISISDPCIVTTGHRDRAAIGGYRTPSALPRLQDQKPVFDSEPVLSQNNRPLQPWTSRVKMNIDKPPANLTKNESSAIAKESCKDSEQLPSQQPEGGGDGRGGWISAHYPERPTASSSGMEQSLLELVKGMVIHQQSTIESQAELMRAVLLDKTGEHTPIDVDMSSNEANVGEVEGKVENAELEDVEDIDNNGPVRIPQMSDVRVTEPSPQQPPYRDFKTSFGRLLSMGAEYGEGLPGTALPRGPLRSDSVIPKDGGEVVLNTLYSAAATAMIKRRNELDNWTDPTGNDNAPRKYLADESPTSIIDNKDGYAGVGAMGSGRVASIDTVKFISHLKQQPQEKPDASRNPHHKPLFADQSKSQVPPGVQFVNDILGVIKEAIGSSNALPMSMPTPIEAAGRRATPLYGRSRTAPSGAKTRGSLGSQESTGDSSVGAADPRYLEQHMIEECVERALRAALPAHMINAKRALGYGSEVRSRVRMADDGIDSACTVTCNDQDTEGEWCDRENLMNNKNSIPSRPSGGFQGRVRSDMSGQYDNDEAEEDVREKPVGRVVAGPGGLVYYGDRDGWNEDRCLDENQYQSYRQSKIPYQRYVNRNGMNHTTLTQPAAEEHYRGSDEEGYDDTQADTRHHNESRKKAFRYGDMNASITRHLRGENPIPTEQTDASSKGIRQNSVPSRDTARPRQDADDVKAIIDQDLAELRDFRRQEEEDRLMDTRSSISEYSSGGENGPRNMPLESRTRSKIPEQAVALEYERRANHRFHNLSRERTAEAHPKHESYTQQQRHVRTNTRYQEPYSRTGFGPGGIPTPLVSKQLGHDATAEVAAIGLSTTMYGDSAQYPPMRDEYYTPLPDSDSDTPEWNVGYPAPLTTNYHGLAASVRDVGGRHQVEPRSRFLHNLQPVSDASSEFESIEGSSYTRPTSDKRGAPSYRQHNDKGKHYLGNIEKAHNASELLSVCSTGTSDSDCSVSEDETASVHKKHHSHHSGDNKYPSSLDSGRKESRYKHREAVEKDSSVDEVKGANGKTESSPVEGRNAKYNDMLRQNVFISKLRLGTTQSNSAHQNRSNNSSLSNADHNDSDGSGASSARFANSANSVGAGEAYYSSIDSDVTVSSTSQSTEMVSGARWGTRY